MLDIKYYTRILLDGDGGYEEEEIIGSISETSNTELSIFDENEENVYGYELVASDLKNQVEVWTLTSVSSQIKEEDDDIPY